MRLHFTLRPMLRLAGFSLVEMAIVLAIIALALAAGLSLVSGQQDAQQLTATNDKIPNLIDAVRTFLSQNYRLPCPAVPTIAPGSPGYGTEAATTGTCTGAVIDSSNSVAEGVLPWATLGLPRDSVVDGYGNLYTYQVALAATALTQATVTSMRGKIALFAAAPTAQGLPVTGNQINACSTTAGDNKCNLLGVIAFMSAGKPGEGAYTVAGLRQPVPNSASEPYAYVNYHTSGTATENQFVMPLIGQAPSSFYELVRVMSPGELMSPLVERGSLSSAYSVTVARMNSIQSAILSWLKQNSSLPAGFTTPAGAAAIAAFQSLPSSTFSDGWGINIIYSPSGLGTSTGPAYALTSYGLDQISSTDDVIVTVTIQELRGLLIAAGISPTF